MPCTRAALACANRSTWSAPFTDTMLGCRAIRPGSLVFSVRSIRTRGLRSIQASNSGLPNANDAVTGTCGSSAPARSRPARRH